MRFATEKVAFKWREIWLVFGYLRKEKEQMKNLVLCNNMKDGRQRSDF